LKPNPLIPNNDWEGPHLRKGEIAVNSHSPDIEDAPTRAEAEAAKALLLRWAALNE
jgi:hypothetical protein